MTNHVDQVPVVELLKELHFLLVGLSLGGVAVVDLGGVEVLVLAAEVNTGLATFAEAAAEFVAVDIVALHEFLLIIKD